VLAVPAEPADPTGTESETTNPDKLEEFVRELVKVGVAELRKEGVISGEPSGAAELRRTPSVTASETEVLELREGRAARAPARPTRSRWQTTAP
jgi:hypothetical protein